MHSDLVELGWTEEQWNRIRGAVTEEAQKARVAAQMLPVVGPEDPSTTAVPQFWLFDEPQPQPPPPRRLDVASQPNLPLTTIAVNVAIHSREAADPNLTAALGKFRRAANYVARIEDALVFNGRPGPGLPPPIPMLGGIPAVFTVHGDGAPDGLMPLFPPPPPPPFPAAVGLRAPIAVWGPRVGPVGAVPIGQQIIDAIVQAINALDAAGQLGPYACALSPGLFAEICRPNQNLVLPRDRILPFLQGPLLRSNSIFEVVFRVPRLGAVNVGNGVVVALSANPIELVVASDIDVRYLQTSEEPRLVFRVSERVALRIKEYSAIATLTAVYW